MTEHSDWLTQVEISGPFLAEPVLREAFPQGFEGLDASKRQTLRKAYDEWREAIDLDDVDADALHQAWIDLVLRQGLEYQDVLRSRDELGDDIRHEVAEHRVTLRPDYAVISAGEDAKPLCLISIYGPEINLTDVSKADAWSASPADRMVDLCRALGVRLGLITNGEHWMLVDAPVGGVASFATWHARLWGQEPVTLQAFINLLGVRRFFVDADHQLTKLLDQSLEHQDEVTEALGEQVRRAIEVLIQSLDRADVDRQRDLLRGLAPRDIYEAALTVMMRIVFLLSAEERGLLLMGDERYEANYAVSTLRLQLRNEPPEILERRWDAWSRLLSTFRIVYGGVEHDALRLPALGGSLFDPDRFPFLEGRAADTSWRSELATPLPIDNRTVLLLLDAVQLFQGRTLSYRALDVEQIGHVYEGLLERTVARAEEATLDLDATKNARHPWVTLPELDAARATGGATLAELLQERTGSAASRVANDLVRAVDDADEDRLLTACHGDQDLRERLKPYFHLIRTDRWGYPLTYPKGTYMVASGSDRRETGAHYTPKSLTEAVVRETLHPIVFTGPVEGLARDLWKLKAPGELLNLKVCDPAMGSGAFLVQVCRYMADRLVEAWAHAESTGLAIGTDGSASDAVTEPMGSNLDERITQARRLVAERCLYGVDLNPLAVELAKLSIWLVTAAKGRPFDYLDHNLRCGDSLLGVVRVAQIEALDLQPDGARTRELFAVRLQAAIDKAQGLRTELRGRIIRDIRDVQFMGRLQTEARTELRTIEVIADALVAVAFARSSITKTDLAIAVNGAIDGDAQKLNLLVDQAKVGLGRDQPQKALPRRPLHWVLAFPEVFSREEPGFDAVVGNPPFLGGKKISGAHGQAYREFLVRFLADGCRGNADLIAYFFLRVAKLVRSHGCVGLIASNSIAEGDTREVGLDRLVDDLSIYHAISSEEWPGAANVSTSRIHLFVGDWRGERILDGKVVETISSSLRTRNNWRPVKLVRNAKKCFQGSIILGLGFTLPTDEALALIAREPSSDRTVLFPYLVGKEVNTQPKLAPKRWVINFWDWPLSEAQKYTELYSRVIGKVKPERDDLKDNPTARGYKEKWWRYGRDGKNLYHAVGRGAQFREHPNGIAQPSEPLRSVIVCATGASKYPCFTIVDNDAVFANSLCVIASEQFGLFAALSSDLHAVWAWEHGSRLTERLRYTHGDVFETYPFDHSLLNASDELEAAGREFFEKRSGYMVREKRGLTKFYNDFHSPRQNSPGLSELRELQARINMETAKVFGVTDVDLKIGFHEVGYLPNGKNLRFTISEAAREELLFRLSELNKAIHSDEARSGLRIQPEDDDDPLDDLFDEDESE